MTARARGQALVMFSLTILLVAVMVCLTLGIGMKAREKVELQTLADAAAYSNAVVTARTFNSISLLNRVAVAHMVNMVATQSLVAYSSAYRVSLKALQVNLDRRAQDDCAAPDPTCDWCSRWNQLNTDALNEIARVDGGWSTFDDRTKNHLRLLASQVRTLHGHQVNMHDELMALLTGQALANAIAQRGDQGNKWAGEISAPAAADLVAVREAGRRVDDCDFTAGQVVCEEGPSKESGIMAALGTRYYEFTTNQANLVGGIEERLETVLSLPRPDNDVRLQQYEGCTRLTDAVDPDGAPGAEGLSGHAEGRIRAQVFLNPLCGTRQTPPGRFTTFVFSSSETNFNDTHVFWWDGVGPVPPQTITEPLNTHSFSGCYDEFGNPEACGMYPGFMDLNPGHVDPANRWVHLYGQPKNIAVVQRDYGVRCAQAAGANCAEVDPWNLFFTARIRQSGTSEVLDNRGLVTAPPDNVDISLQTAVAAGLTYYHRMGHWREPPNFFNPYWRATLVSPGIDTQGHPILGGTDIQAVVGATGATFAVDVVNELAAQGFRGWQ